MRKPRCSPPASPPSVSARRSSSPPRGRAPTTRRWSRSGTSQTGCFCAAVTAPSFFSPAGGCRSTAPSSGSRPPRAAPSSAVRASSSAAGSALCSTSTFRATSRPRPPAGTDVAPSALPATDEYLAFAPFGDRLIFQAGQFDVPFTLENRTSDAYTDFIERAMVARSLGAPRNKEVGVMVARPPRRRAILLFGWPLQRRRARSSATSTINRTPSGAWWRRRLPAATAGGAASRSAARPGTATTSSVPRRPVQATPGGMVFFEPHWTSGQTAPLSFELHEQGTVTAFGGELNLPIGHRFGLRGEVVWKRQHLAEDDTSQGLATPVGDATLDGHQRLRGDLVLAAGRRPAAPCPRAGAAASNRRLPAPVADRRVAARRAGGGPEGESDQRQPDAGRSRRSPPRA